MDKRSNETPTSGIHMERNVESPLLLKLVQRRGNRLYRFVLQRVGYAQRRYNADGVFVAALDDLLRTHQQPLAFTWHLSDFHVEVATEFVPADLHRPTNQIRPARIFALLVSVIAPSGFQR